MNKNATYALAAVIIIIIAGGSFYGGMLYGKSKGGSISGGNFPGGPGGMRGQMNDTTGSTNKIGNKQGTGQGFISGEIISISDKLVTIKSQNGGSKIIMLADSTQISKSASGTASDLIVGKNVMVNGKSNSDGSLTATYVTLRPDQDHQPAPQDSQNQPAAQN